MPHICAVVNCKTTMIKKDDDVHLYCFPKVNSRYNVSLNNILERRRSAWIRALRRGEFTDDQINKMRICSLHFIEGKPAKFQQVEHPDWVPTLNMGYVTNTPPSEQRLSRYKRQTKERNEVPVKENDCVPLDLNRTVEIEVYSEPVIDVEEHIIEVDEIETPLPETLPFSASPITLHLKIEEQATEIHNLKTELEGLKSELQTVKSELVARNNEVYKLREKVIKYSYCAESFNDDKKLLFYTGIPHLGLFNVILKHLNLGPVKLSQLSNSLDSFQILLLILMKLRLSTSFRALGYKFSIAERTASLIFQKGIILIHHAIRRFVHWPSREELLYSVPQCFLDTFGKRVAVIIDCFEIAIQKPASLKARGETFSQYKQKNTVKYLIGIAPCGAVTFISQGWGGRTSDKHITENCEILDLLEPGDIILADRGFTVSQEVGLRYATLKTPAFTEGKPQLSPQAIEESRKVSSVRIHVERVIGTLRNKFKLLNGPIPISLLKCKHDGNSLVDYIVTVCCALTNMCDSVVPN